MVEDKRRVEESDLLTWLRNTWGEGGQEPVWEGGEEGGCVLLPLYPRMVPVELKVNKQKRAARWFKTPVSSSQMKYHQEMAGDRLFSAYLIARGEKDNFDVFAMPGYVKIWDHHDVVGWYLVGEKQNPGGMKDREALKGVLRKIESEFYPIDKEGNQVMPW